ncbi:MAG: ATP-binding cassette domain-containing protein [Hymenobacter sp.]|nr:MAG: ATP-binding cassette domain-containing protein [Hymenobacter sp.]
MIEISNIEKSFDGNQILKGITCTLETGKCNLLLGGSGTGKSVLLSCIVGLMKPDIGSITFDGTMFTNSKVGIRQEIRRKIGMLFQGSALFDSMTVEQNILFPLDMFGDMDGEAKKKRVNEVLERVELKDANKKFPSEISGGMKKRVGIARAIVLNPKYLFCDEPNSGLDPQTSAVIDKLIQDITYEYKMTTIINTHDMNSVLEMGDHIVYMHKGSKYWEGTKDEIIMSKDEMLNHFIFASEFLQDAKEVRMHNEEEKAHEKK